jgi:hypothetical protein
VLAEEHEECRGLLGLHQELRDPIHHPEGHEQHVVAVDLGGHEVGLAEQVDAQAHLLFIWDLWHNESYTEQATCNLYLIHCL